MLEAGSDKGFICRPDTYDACIQGAAYPVGFPISDLFWFEPSLFARLESAVRRRDKRASQSIWAEAKAVTVLE